MTTVIREQHIIDAAGVSMGRIASRVALLLMGKNKPSYLPHKDEGDFVKVINYSQIVFTGKKMEQKRYYRPTERPGHLKSETLATLWKRDPKAVLKKAVYGMLPKNSLRPEMMKRLTMQD